MKVESRYCLLGRILTVVRENGPDVNYTTATWAATSQLLKTSQEAVEPDLNAKRFLDVRTSLSGHVREYERVLIEHSSVTCDHHSTIIGNFLPQQYPCSSMLKTRPRVRR